MQLDIEFEISCANLNHFMIVLAQVFSCSWSPELQLLCALHKYIKQCSVLCLPDLLELWENWILFQVIKILAKSYLL